MARTPGAQAPRRPAVLPDPPDPPGLARRFRWSVLAAAAGVVTFLGWLYSDVGTPFQRRVVSDLAFCVVPLIATASAWSAHRRRRERHTAWKWIAAGCLTWAFGSIVWTFYGIVLGNAAPFPSYADLGYVLYSVPIAIGVTRFPTARGSRWSRIRLGLDVLVMTGCLLLASAIWVLGPVVDATSNGFARIDALAYPLADVTVASAVLSRSMVFSRSRRLIWMTLAVGLLVEALTDSVYVTKTFGGSYTPGHLLDIGWIASFLLVALAAQAPVATAAREPGVVAEESPTLLQQLLPYATVAIAALALLDRPSQFQRHGQYFWITVTLGVIVALRQLVVVGDHVALTSDLSAAVRRRTAELEHHEQWWRDLVQNLSDVVMVVGVGGAVQYCSPSVRTALGHWPAHLDTLDGLASQLHPEDVDAVRAQIAPVLVGRTRRGAAEARILRADGSYGWFEISAVGQLAEKALQGAVLTLHDVTERHRLTERLAHQAYHDALTELPNRALLMQRIEKLLDEGVPEFALVLVDLDDFKLINDSHGHAAGDLVLEAIGKRLTGTVRAQDTVARLGGDEFAVLVAGPGERARKVARRISERIAKPVVVGGRRFVVSSSIGVVLATADDDESARSLLSHADIALYEAKAKDKGGIVVISGEARVTAARQVYLREQIAQPKLEQFSVVYQPIVDLGTGQVRGLEALLRWQHPELGAVSPADFVPLAEHGGSIGVLGWHVLETAVGRLVGWQREFPDRRLAVGVNVSVLQLDEPGFAQRVLDLVEASGLEPDQVVLELTEQALARDFETAVSVVAELRRGGISVAVDDYGTGYSSLRYLHRFAADVVKIDRSFIANLEGSAHTQKIVRSVVDMATSLDLQCIAEGIETDAQLKLVRALGCELAQGYLFARPVHVDEVASVLAAPAFQVAPVQVPRPRRKVASAASA